MKLDEVVLQDEPGYALSRDNNCRKAKPSWLLIPAVIVTRHTVHNTVVHVQDSPTVANNVVW